MTWLLCTFFVILPLNALIKIIFNKSANYIFNKVGNCSIIPCPVFIFYNSHGNELMKRQGRVKKWSGLYKSLVESLSI